MKRADLEKVEGRKLDERMRREPSRERYGTVSAEPGDRREQRKRDQAAGLVPFAVKLPGELVAALQARAKSTGTPLNELTAGLLRDALRQDRE